jgi:hypothetical protein
MKSQKQLNFLHSLAGDKKKAGGPITPASLMAAPMAGGVKPMMPAAPGPAPMMNPAPVAVTHMPQPAAPRLMPPGAKPPMMPPRPPMNPVAAPSLPAGGNLPKFGKMRNSLRGSPFNKSNKA